MQNQEFITTSARQTQKLGALLAEETQGSTLGEKKARVICLSGDLGAGKTTFTQGLLKGLGVKGPYTSPTFLVIKNYQKKIQNPKSKIQNKFKIQNSKNYQIPDTKYRILNIFHIDAYRIKSKDLLSLGWEEMLADKNNILIIEWPERVKKIIPKDSLWINFEWLDEKQRKLTLK